MLGGKTFRGRMFIDATYEGDLMAAAGVKYAVGREGTDVYDEKWNGVQVGVLHHRHHFDVMETPVDRSSFYKRLENCPARRQLSEWRRSHLTWGLAESEAVVREYEKEGRECHGRSFATKVNRRMWPRLTERCSLFHF